MTNEQLKAILNTLPNDTILLIDTNNEYVDVETIIDKLEEKLLK